MATTKTLLLLAAAIAAASWLSAASGASTALLLQPLPPANISLEALHALLQAPAHALQLLARVAAPLALAPVLAAPQLADLIDSLLAWLAALPAAAHAWASGIVADGPFLSLSIGPSADYPTVSLESLLLAAIALAALGATALLAQGIRAARRTPAARRATAGSQTDAPPATRDSATTREAAPLVFVNPPPPPPPMPARRFGGGGGHVAPCTPDHSAAPGFLPRGPAYADRGAVHSYQERTWVAIVMGWYLRACCPPELLSSFALHPGALTSQADWDAAADRLYKASAGAHRTAFAAVRTAIERAAPALSLPAEALCKYDYVAGILVAANWPLSAKA